MLRPCDQETIIAKCTPTGSGALALLRISGEHARVIAAKISVLPNGKSLLTCKTHTIAYGHIIDQDAQIVDQVLFLLMDAPQTFTGDNTVEITCHNNQFIIQKIIDLAINAGARIAQNGEFTQRAVINNKIDITQAEAIHDLIHAHSEQALKKSMQQLSGTLTAEIAQIEQLLFQAYALCESSFEFLDEEMDFSSDIKNILTTVVDKIITIKDSFNQQRQIREGVRIAILGSVNAGKSSLFNRLVSSDRAIVTNIPGTTRDSIEAGMYVRGAYWTCIDTAGLRTTNDVIEQEGIVRSLQQADRADIILLVFDGSQSLPAAAQTEYRTLLQKHVDKTVLIQNKIDSGDVGHTLPAPAIKISTVTATNIPVVLNAIDKKIKYLSQGNNCPFLVNQRQYNTLQALEKKIITAQSLITAEPAYEILAYHLNDILAELNQLTGKSISEATMDKIFKDFCIGK